MRAKEFSLDTVNTLPGDGGIMLLSEIEKVPADVYSGEQYTLMPDDQKANLRRLPGKSGYFYFLDDLYQLKIVTPDKKKIVALMQLNHYNFPTDNTVQVGTISVDPEYRGQGLAMALYGIVLLIMLRTLVSGDSQTPAGQRMWTVLWILQKRIPRLSVRGYFSIADDQIDDAQDIPVIVGELGAEYLGEVNNYHVFAFDVKPRASGRELKAAIETEFSKIYGTTVDRVNEVGLFARIE
jgi:GNAT superfamily N-acetyltransferase